MMGGKVGAPDAGASGSAGNTQQIIETAEYDYTTELVAIEEALTRIYGHDEEFADHRRGLVDCPYFGVATDRFIINVTIRKHDGGTA